jgi:D-glycero-alpha-D-manno-heptose-7-phosphate kinase
MIISRTPFRISLSGGGSDIPEYYQRAYGAVVSMSVSLYMYVTVNRRFDDSIRVSYTKLEIVDRAADVQHDLIRAALRMAGIDHGVEITTVADVPGGTGLGSSSSLTVGVLNALYAYRGIRLSPQDLARRACEIEIGVLNRPIGKQDQFMAALGGLRHLKFHPRGAVTAAAIPCRPSVRQQLINSLLLFYTGIERDGNAILAEVRRGIALQASRRERLDRVVALTDDLAARLRAGDLSTLGDTLNSGWSEKRRMASGVTTRKLDRVLAAAREAGATGGKILGAGGGGFLLVHCSPQKQFAVRQRLSSMGLLPVRFNFEPQGSRIVFSDAPRASRRATARRPIVPRVKQA